MVTPDGRVKILDFGIAKIMSPGAGHGHTSRATVAQQSETASGLLQGTVPYMSPSNRRVRGAVDFRLIAPRSAFCCMRWRRAHERSHGRPRCRR